MAYSDGEALIANLITQLDGFSAVNASRADWSLLNNGKSDHYVVLRRGRSADRWWIAPNVYRAAWLTVVEVWQKQLADNFETRSRLFEHVETIMRLLEYPRLGDTSGAIDDSDIPEVGDVEQMWQSDGGPVFLRIEMQVVWYEERQIDFTE